MKKYVQILVGLALIQSCSKNSSPITAPPPPNPCNLAAISTSSVAADTCLGQGKLTVVTPTGAGFQYKLNNGTNQSSVEFTALYPGKYKLTVSTPTGCTTSDSVLVLGIATTPGPKFLAVKTLFAANCTPCHFGPAPSAGINLSSNCNITQYWERIKARAVDGNPSPMPQGGLMPIAERNKITEWINAGHRVTD